MIRINPDDIKVTVTLTEGYRERYTAACLKILERRRRQQEMGRMRREGEAEEKGA